MLPGSGRYGSRWLGGIGQFIRFAIVGGSGVLVNMFVVVVATRIADACGVSQYHPVLNLFGTRWNVRWFHVFMVLAFLVANTWNYQINRIWTFQGARTKSWWRGFIPFLLTGLGALAISLVVAHLVVSDTSPFALPEEIFDDSTGFRTRSYWGSFIGTLVAMPVNFIINKFWTFRAPRSRIVAEHPPVGAEEYRDRARQ